MSARCYRLRDAITAGWPVPLEIEEHTHAGMANRYVAGASGLPFAVLRGAAGTDLVRHTRGVATVRCPFTGEHLTAVAALNPDVTIVHAQRADRDGNVRCGASRACRRRPCSRPGTRW